jgi:hypothetical protein
MKERQLDLFDDTMDLNILRWLPGSNPPKDGQKIMEVYENDDGTPSEIIISTFDCAAHACGFLRPILWWAPLPNHPISKD